MSNWVIYSPQFEEDTPSRIVVVSSPGLRRIRLFMLGLLILGGVGGIILGLASGDTTMTIGLGAVCLLPALLLGLVMPLSTKITMEKQMRRLVLTKQHLLGYSQWPRDREVVLNLSEITRVNSEAPWMGNAYFVNISTSSGETISLQFGKKEEEAKRTADKIREWVSPALATPLQTEPEEAASPPVSIERLSLAAVYGLITALILGHLWALLTTTTETKFAYASLAMGAVIGIVVSIISGGSKDARYSAIGALVAGIGIAFGEFLIFGIPESKFFYEFEGMDLLIYGVAVYEGWIIPRRSIPLSRRWPNLIHDDNQKPLLAAGAGVLLLVMWVSMVTGRMPTPQGAQAKIHFDRGITLAEEGKFGESISELEEAIRLKSDYAMAHQVLGAMHYEMGNVNEAQAAFENAIEFDPSLALAHALLANVYNDIGRYNEGIDHANEALRLDPSMPEGFLALGYLNTSLGQFDEGKAAFLKTIELDDSFPDPHFILGLLYAEEGDFDLALESLNRVFDLDIEPDYKAYVYYWRGTILIEMDRHEEAISDIEAALELGLDPDFEQAAESFLEELQ